MKLYSVIVLISEDRHKRVAFEDFCGCGFVVH
jgi:hypothetical protein